MNKQKIIKAINEGIQKALLNFEDDIKLDKVKTSLDHLSRQDINEYKHSLFKKCKFGDYVYMNNQHQYIISPNKNKEWDKLRLIGYCVGESSEFYDGMPRFIFTGPISGKYRIQNTIGFSKNHLLKNLETYDDILDYLSEDQDGWKNTEALLKSNSDAAEACKKINDDFYIPAAGEFIICSELMFHSSKSPIDIEIDMWTSTQESEATMWQYSNEQGMVTFPKKDLCQVIPFIHITKNNINRYVEF